MGYEKFFVPLAKLTNKPDGLVALRHSKWLMLEVMTLLQLKSGKISCNIIMRLHFPDIIARTLGRSQLGHNETFKRIVHLLNYYVRP